MYDNVPIADSTTAGAYEAIEMRPLLRRPLPPLLRRPLPPRVKSEYDEAIEMRPLLRRPQQPLPRVKSEYDEAYTMLDNCDIEAALKILDSDKWQSAESFLNPMGSEKITVVHFAACRGNLQILERAAALQVPMYAVDEFGRCALHYASGRGHVQVINWLLQNSDEVGGSSAATYSAHPQLSLADHYGRTALHEAVQCKHVDIVRILVNAGANVNARDVQGVPPFLLAHCNVTQKDPAMMSRYEEIVDILASGRASVTIVHPLTGWSVLHYAVARNSWKATTRLIQCGAQTNCCRMGRLTTTPVHLAARFGYHETLCILLKDLPPSFVDKQNEYGWSALHLAAVLGNPACVRALVNKGGDLAKKNPHGNTAIDLLSMFKQDADLVAFFTDMLDTKVRFIEKNPAQIIYEIVLDFQMLIPEGQLQMAVVSSLIKTLPRMEQLAILQHPVLAVFLETKWSCVRYVFYSYLIVNVVFVLILSSYAILLVQKDLDSPILRRTLLFSACISFSHIVLRFFIEPKRYCRQFQMWLSLTCVTTCIAVAVASEFTPNSVNPAASEDHDDPNDSWPPLWIRNAISIAILLAYIRIMLLAGRLPTWGIYALIFSTVLQTVLKVLFIGIWIVISFALSFLLLFHNKDQFDNPFNALIKTIVMMTGEYDYDDIFRPGEKNSTVHDVNHNIYESITSRIIFLGFVLLASVVLMNLMIGMAVSNIQELVKQGQHNRLVKQAEFIADCEKMGTATARTILKHLLPTCVTKMLKSPIDRRKNLLWHWGHKRHHDISKELWKDLFKLCVKNRNLDKKFVPTTHSPGDVISVEQSNAMDDSLDDIYEYIDGPVVD